MESFYREELDPKVLATKKYPHLTAGTLAEQSHDERSTFTGKQASEEGTRTAPRY